MIGSYIQLHPIPDKIPTFHEESSSLKRNLYARGTRPARSQKPMETLRFLHPLVPSPNYPRRSTMSSSYFSNLLFHVECREELNLVQFNAYQTIFLSYPLTISEKLQHLFRSHRRVRDLYRPLNKDTRLLNESYLLLGD